MRNYSASLVNITIMIFNILATQWHKLICRCASPCWKSSWWNINPGARLPLQKLPSDYWKFFLHLPALARPRTLKLEQCEARLKEWAGLHPFPRKTVKQAFLPRLALDGPRAACHQPPLQFCGLAHIHQTSHSLSSQPRVSFCYFSLSTNNYCDIFTIIVILFLYIPICSYKTKLYASYN